MFWCFEILAPQPGFKPTTPALKDEVLNTGPPGKSLGVHFYLTLWFSRDIPSEW